MCHCSEEEKKKYLEELEVEMRLLGKNGYADAQREASVVRARQPSPRETFPQLSCLNKDELLSHAMKVPLTSKVPAADSQSLPAQSIRVHQST